jgi:hypothetical protein
VGLGSKFRKKKETIDLRLLLSMLPAIVGDCSIQMLLTST